MKFSISAVAVLFLFSKSVVSETTSENSTEEHDWAWHRERRRTCTDGSYYKGLGGVFEPCLTSYSLTLTNKDCTYENVHDAVKAALKKENKCDGRDPEHELKMLIPTLTPVSATAELEAYINEKCADAFAETQDKGLDFIDITGMNENYVKSYFDGGTYEYNEAIQGENRIGETVNVLAEDPGERIDFVYEIAKTQMFDWPGKANGNDDGDPYTYGISNFNTCAYNTAMCCWVSDRQANDGANNGNCATPYDEKCQDADPGDNTDLCFVDFARAPQSARVAGGYAVFPGDNTEGAIHCHGFAWGTGTYDPTALFKANNLFYVSMYDHLKTRGYVRNVPGAPMCGCIEQMPVVSRSDCTQVDLKKATITIDIDDTTYDVTIEGFTVQFNSCDGATANDLAAEVAQMASEGKLPEGAEQGVAKTLVGNCDSAEAKEILKGVRAAASGAAAANA